LHEGLFGAHPYDGDGRQDGVPGWLRRAVRRGLAEDPLDRYPSMGAMLMALERGRRAGVARGVAAAMALLLLVAGLFAYAQASRHEADTAREQMAKSAAQNEKKLKEAHEAEQQVRKEIAELHMELDHVKSQSEARIHDLQQKLATKEEELATLV